MMSDRYDRLLERRELKQRIELNNEKLRETKLNFILAIVGAVTGVVGTLTGIVALIISLMK